MSSIQITGLSVCRGTHTVLQHVDFRIEKAELLAIIGPNESGGSAFLRAVISAVPAWEGHIEHLTSLRIGYLQQKLYIGRTFPMAVAQFFCLPHPVPMVQVNTALHDADLPDLGRKKIADLSSDQFQRVLLARALLSLPELLLLDKATQG